MTDLQLGCIVHERSARSWEAQVGLQNTDGEFVGKCRWFPGRNEDEAQTRADRYIDEVQFWEEQQKELEAAEARLAKRKKNSDRLASLKRFNEVEEYVND